MASNDDEFKQRVLYFGSRIERWLMNDGVAAEDAADLAQVVVERAVRYQRSFNPSRELGAWLRRIARNVARDHLRRSGRTPDTSELSEDLPAPSNPERDYILHENRWLVAQMWKELPDRVQALLNARFVDDLSIAETADLLQMPASTVHDLLHRTLGICEKRLRKKGLPVVLPLLARVQEASEPRTAWSGIIRPRLPPSSLLHWVRRWWREATLVLGGATAGGLLVWFLTLHHGATHLVITPTVEAAAVMPQPAAVAPLQAPVCTCPEVVAPPAPPADCGCPDMPIPNTRQRSAIRAVLEAAERGDMDTALRLLSHVNGPEREQLRRRLLAMPATSR